MKLFNTFDIKSRNIFLSYINTLFAGMLFFLPILALYIERDLFTLTNVAIIYSVQAMVVVILEYPTGAITDLIGRKKSMIIANVSILLGILFLSIGGDMKMFLIFAVLNGAGMSFYSGAHSALIYDTLAQEKREKYFKKIIGTKYALWPVGAVIGSVVGGYLASVSLSLPIYLSFIPVGIALTTVFLLKEPEYEKEKHRNIFKQMFKSSKIIFKNKQLILLVLSAFILVGIGDSIHSLKPIFFEFKNIPIIYFGYIFAASFALSSLGHYFSHNISEKIGNKQTLIMSSFFLIIFIFMATFVSPWAAIFFLLLKQIFYGLGRPSTEHLLNLETDSKTRATVLSGYNLMRHLGIAIFIPLMGYFSEVYSINMGFRIGALMMVAVIIVFAFLKNKN